jgi:hypothetical protein
MARGRQKDAADALPLSFGIADMAVRQLHWMKARPFSAGFDMKGGDQRSSYSGISN